VLNIILYHVRFQVLTARSLMMEAVRTSETSVDNHFTRQYNPEDSSERSYIMVVITVLHCRFGL
jgi:hypothetical protein